MLRRPTGIIILLLALFGLTTIAGGLAGGQWGFEHVRGRSMLPLAGVALILLAIAGDRRWITAVTTEGAAIISAVWGLNYARLLLKWGGDASATDLVITAVLGLGCIAASVLFIRARPQTTPRRLVPGKRDLRSRPLDRRPPARPRIAGRPRTRRPHALDGPAGRDVRDRPAGAGHRPLPARGDGRPATSHDPRMGRHDSGRRISAGVSGTSSAVDHRNRR